MNKLAEKIKKNKEDLAKEKSLKNILADISVYETNIKNIIDNYPSIISLIVAEDKKNEVNKKEIDKIVKRGTDMAKSPFVLLAKKFSPYEVFKYSNDALIKIQKLENKFGVIFNKENLNYNFLMISYSSYEESLNKANELGKSFEEPKYKAAISQISEFHNKTCEKYELLNPQLIAAKKLISKTNEDAKCSVMLDITKNRMNK